MKRILVILLASLMLFSFIACDDNTPTPPASEEPDTPTVDPDTPTPEEPEGEDWLSKIEKTTDSLTISDGVGKIVGLGAYFQPEYEDGKTYELSYDLTLDKTFEGTIEFNHNFVGETHYGQAFLVLDPEATGVKATLRPEASTIDAEELGIIEYANDSTVTVKAVYAPVDEDTWSVTVSVNGHSFKAVETPVDKTTAPSSLFWCIYNAGEGCGSISNCRLLTK